MLIYHLWGGIMDWLRENGWQIIGIILLYFLFPAYISAAVWVMGRRFWLFDRGKADNIFDFFANIMYPWRWRKRRRAYKKRKRKQSMKTVTLYTDGACSGNPGPGGWGAILMFGEHKKELSGGEKSTTNNRMELTAVIRGLEALKEPCVVELYSDSKYVIDALQKGWAKGWRARGWVKADKKPALNPDLWERLLELCATHTVNLHWVKGHADNPNNNRCDELAVGEWRKLK